MPRPIELIRAKVVRANQHIQDLQAALDAFYSTKPYEIKTKDDLDRGKRVYYVSKVDDVPLEIATIAADILQNLRSAIDHIAYQLILKSRGGTPPDWSVYYPIAPSATDYKSSRDGNIKGVSQAVIDAINATEPYKGGKGHALWQLNSLNKVDKHRLLIATGSFVRNIDVSSLFRDSLRQVGMDHIADMIEPLLLRPADNQIAFEVGAAVYEEPINRDRSLIIRPGSDIIIPGKPTFKDDIKVTFDISFNNPGVIQCEPVIKTVKDMANLVGNIVDAFDPFL